MAFRLADSSPAAGADASTAERGLTSGFAYGLVSDSSRDVEDGLHLVAFRLSGVLSCRGMKVVLRTCDEFQVLQTVVVSSAVDVVYLQLFGNGTMKGLPDGSVDGD